MMRKILDLLFEDSESEYVEEVLVPETNTEPILKKEEPKLKTIESSNVNKSFEIKEKIDKNDSIEKPKQEMKNRIDIDEIQAKPLKKVKPVLNKVEYEFTPPISPIFGVVSNGDSVEKKAPIQPVTKKNPTSKIGTIISPYYGIEIKEEVKSVSNKPIIKEVEQQLFDDTLYAVDDTVNNLSLDELLKEENNNVSTVESSKIIVSKNMSLFDDEDED